MKPLQNQSGNFFSVVVWGMWTWCESDVTLVVLYLELLDAELMAVLLGTGQHVVKGIMIFLLSLLPSHLLLNNLLHIGMQDFSGFDPLDTEPTCKFTIILKSLFMCITSPRSRS